MKETKHLNYFKVENFKSFGSLELNDIGQFNLISGDNNVGKTSLLEALLFDSNLIYCLDSFFGAFVSRYNLKADLGGDFNFMDTYLNKRSIPSEKINYRFSYTSSEIKEYSLLSKTIEKLTTEEKEKLKSHYVSNVNLNLSNIVVLKEKNTLKDASFILNTGVNKVFYYPYIPSGLNYLIDLVQFYSEKIQPSKELERGFVSELNAFIDEVEDIDISTSILPNRPVIALRVKGIDSLIPLSMFGEGSVKLFRILVQLKMAKNKYLLIDEIGSGVHYSRLKQFWRIILESAKANNVQLFATTHSLECIKYFKEALEEVEIQKDARYFVMEKVKDGKIKAFTYNFDQFASAIDIGNEIRGGY